MKPQGSVASVVAAIREDGAAEIERLEKGAQGQIDELERDDAAPVEQPEREPRLAAARRQVRERQAREDWADSRSVLEARERFFAAAAARGRQLMLALPDAEREADLERLLREAIVRLPAGRLVVSVAPRDRPLLDRVLQKVPGCSAGADANILGGCVVRTAGSNVSLDESWEERARRMEAALRGALGKVFGS